MQHDGSGAQVMLVVNSRSRDWPGTYAQIVTSVPDYIVHVCSTSHSTSGRCKHFEDSLGGPPRPLYQCVARLKKVRPVLEDVAPPITMSQTTSPAAPGSPALSDDVQTEAPLTMEASTMLTTLPVDTKQALATAGKLSIDKGKCFCVARLSSA